MTMKIIGLMTKITCPMASKCFNSTGLKIPHRKNIGKMIICSDGVGICSCGQTISYSSQKDFCLKVRLHKTLTFCKDSQKFWKAGKFPIYYVKV